ncbi:4-dimethylallyl tryptophan synthase [Xylaria nigripes]|nr:4-dimethylallyl tryptophan synthase [Xylaria nigripes]
MSHNLPSLPTSLLAMSATKTPSMPRQEVHAIISNILDFPDEEQRLWWYSTAPMFAEMLKITNYSTHAQLTHLITYIVHIIPFLGVYPRNGRKRWLSILTRYGSPFELSLNCSNSVVRYTFEPINAATGTDADPFNTHAIWESLQHLATIQPAIDLRYFSHFKRHLTVDAQESSYLLENSLVGAEIRTQNKLALDLDGSQFVVKVYFYPTLKSIATGRSIQDLVFGAARELVQGHANTAASLAMLEEYIVSRGPESTACPRLLSCDLVDPSRSRIKIYVSEQNVTLSAMQDLWTLGGRRNDSDTLAGLHLVQELWDLLRVPPGIRAYPEGYLPLGTKPDELLPSMANYTLTPNDPAPEPQLYFAVFGMNDMKVADALTIFFERHGWVDMAEKYKNSIKTYYPHENHEALCYVHAYVSFSYRKNRPYLCVYLQTFETGNWSTDYHRRRDNQDKSSTPYQVVRLGGGAW